MQGGLYSTMLHETSSGIAQACSALSLPSTRFNQSYQCKSTSRTLYLRRLPTNHKLQGQDVDIQLVSAIVLLRLDYCNGGAFVLKNTEWETRFKINYENNWNLRTEILFLICINDVVCSGNS